MYKDEMEDDERKSIAEILALDLPQRLTASETALFTWHSDLRAWQCRNIHDKIALCQELRLTSWTCVESRLANLRLVRDRADAAVERGISLLHVANHYLFRKYVFYGPHLDFQLVRRSVVLHLSDVLNIDFATLYPLLQQVCDIKHFLYFAGIHENKDAKSTVINHQPHTTSSQLQQQQTSNNNDQQVFTWENLRHIWKFYVTPNLDHQQALTTLANTVKQPIHFIQNQFYNLEKLEKHIDAVLQEGVTLLPGPDTDLWLSFRQNNPLLSGDTDITMPLGFNRSQTVGSGPQVHRLALIRALKRFLYIADVHGQLDGAVETLFDAGHKRKQAVVYTISQLQLMYRHRLPFLLDKQRTISNLASTFQREQSSVRQRMDDLLRMEKRIDNLECLDYITLLPGPDATLWKLFWERSGSLSVPVHMPALYVAEVLQLDVVYVRERLNKIRALKKFLLIANIYDDTTPHAPSTVNNNTSHTTTTAATNATLGTFDDCVSVTSLGAYSDNDQNSTHPSGEWHHNSNLPDWESVINMELLFEDVAMDPQLQHNELNPPNGDNNIQLDSMECDSISDLSMPLDVTDYVAADNVNTEPLLPATDAAPTGNNAYDTPIATVPITGQFTLMEDQLIWQSWNERPLCAKPEIQELMRRAATQLNRRSTTIQTRVNYLLRLEQQVNSIVAEGASFLPSSITELYNTYINISGDTRVNSKTVDTTAAKRLQQALQPPYSVYNVLQEVKLVKWYLWLRDIHNSNVSDSGGPALSVCTNPTTEAVCGNGKTRVDNTVEADFLCDVATLWSDNNSSVNDSTMGLLEDQPDTTTSSQVSLTSPTVSTIQSILPPPIVLSTLATRTIRSNISTFTSVEEERIWQIYLQHQRNHHLSLPFLLTNLAQRLGRSYHEVNAHLQLLLGKDDEFECEMRESTCCVGDKRDQCDVDNCDVTVLKRSKCI